MTPAIEKLPLERLSRDGRTLESRRLRSLAREQIRELLRSGPVEFVIAAIGAPLRWVPPGDCYAFWKSDAAPHLAESDEIHLDSFPDGLAYVASEWQAPGSNPIVLLEAHD